MFKVLLCDDDPKACAALRENVTELLRGQAAELTSCTSAEEVMERMERGECFSLCFLDIVMPAADGIALGRAIRAQNPRACIVYVTSSKEYALEAFGVHAFRYLLKPVRRSELEQLIREFLDIYARREQEETFVFKTRDGLVSVGYSDILWIENQHRSVTLILRDKSCLHGTSNRSSFETNISPLLENGPFLQTHKSYAVNMNYIRRLLPDSVVLDDGSEIPLSRNNAARVKHSYFQFLSEEGSTRR